MTKKHLWSRARDELRLAICTAAARVHNTHYTRWLELRSRFLKYKGTTQVISANGTNAQFHVRTLGDYLHLLDEYFEVDEITRFVERLRRDDVVCEVGGHIGSWTVFLAKAVDNGQVCSFEPFNDNFQSLEENVKLNHLDNVKLFNLALGSINGTAPLAVCNEQGSGRHSLIKRQDHEGAVTIPVMRLDDAVQKLGMRKPTAVKIDCEGGEVDVLEGMTNLLGDGCIRVIQVEIHDNFLKNIGHSSQTVYDMLFEFDYELAFEIKRAPEVMATFTRK